MAKAAFATWNHRIAPVFDVARSIQLVVTANGRMIHQEYADISGAIPSQKVYRLADLDINALICGAISRPLHAMIAAYHIEVIPFVAGDLQEVIQAWLDGKLAGTAAYAMPGCRNTVRHGFNVVQRIDRRMEVMKSEKLGMKGTGQASGRCGQGNRGNKCTGQRRNAQRQSQISGAGVFSSLNVCLCPQCGHLAPHERGTPCTQLKCPQCGAVMTKQ